MLVRPIAATLAALLLLSVSACSKQDQSEFLQPLAELARGAITEADNRIDKAAALLKDDVATAPQVARVLGTGADGEDVAMNWDNSPYIAAGVVSGEGKLLAMFPRGSNGFEELLAKAGSGPAVGDLEIIPNTFSFTLPMHFRPDGGDTTLGALIDVDRVLLDGVLKPVAGAAGGYAFLANKDQRVILATHPALIGQPLSKWQVPVAASGQDAVGQVKLAGIESYVATATSAGERGWILGVLTPVTEK